VPPAAPLSERVPAHLDALARVAREHGGTRAAATPGGAASEAYVAGRLRALGWTVRQEEVAFDAFTERRPPVLRAGGRTYRAGREVASLTYSGAGTARGALRTVRALGCAPADHAALRRGEVAVVTRGTCTLRRKAQLAADRGAAAVVIVNSDRSTIPGTLGTPALRLPVVGVGAAAGAGLRRAEGVEATVRVDARSGRQVARNVVADAPWGDPGRVVMAGAHLDSVDAGAGMNDNASGVAALLAAAERLTARPPADGARLRVAFWAAEELGLIGSRRHVARLDAGARRALRAYVNLDMVGSPEGRAMVYGAGEVASALRSGVRAEGLTPGRTSIGSASDHAAACTRAPAGRTTRATTARATTATTWTTPSPPTWPAPPPAPSARSPGPETVRGAGPAPLSGARRAASSTPPACAPAPPPPAAARHARCPRAS
jgi:hypothetical protein